MEIDNVNHPQHYTEGLASLKVECINITREMPFSLGNAFKYVWRAGRKGSLNKAIEDLAKARWYLRDTEEFGLPSDHLRTARHIFALLVPESTPRYTVLRAIITLNIYEAMRSICEMEVEFKKELMKDERA